MKQDVVQG